jgi:hypothetical protein
MAAGGVAGLEQPLLESFTPKNHSRLRFAGINVTCLGGTLAELADTIQAAGGQVPAALTLLNAGRRIPELLRWVEPEQNGPGRRRARHLPPALPFLPDREWL